MTRVKRSSVAVALAVSVCVSDSVPVSASASDSVARVPVVVELFSSEGCSSCPPADRVLARLDRDQPVAGAEVIALELHVDYWNQLGWRDPFSQAAFSARQRMHAYAMTRTTRVYTPQLVVDGRDELVGSNASGAASVIARAAREAHLAVKVARQGDVVKIDVGPAPASEGATHVMLATTERGLRSSPTSGENSGDALEHGPVVRALRFVGDLGATGLVAQTTQPQKAGVRVVVFVEGRDSLHVLGAATLD